LQNVQTRIAIDFKNAIVIFEPGKKKKDPLQLFGDHCRVVSVVELGSTTRLRVDHALSGIAKNGVGIETKRHRIYGLGGLGIGLGFRVLDIESYYWLGQFRLGLRVVLG
jgi:hypothetical protein